MNRLDNIGQAAQKLTDFIRAFVAASGLDRLVIGLSGGLDSSLSAALGQRAVGKDRIMGLIMPYRSSSPDSENDAMATADLLGIKTEKIDISPMIDAYFGGRSVPMLRRGNKMARERMAILFDVAARDGCLVLGTSNKTEICLGYGTWYGDVACSLNPLGGLYKREIREMAAHLGIPQRIIEKKPTADLWPGQTDEGELGITYDLADRVLYAVVEEGERRLKKLLETGADEATIMAIVERLNRYAYKRVMPATELLGSRPIPAAVVLS